MVILATAGVRSAPGVPIVPLEHAFGWNAATISGAISLNIRSMAWSGRSPPRSSKRPGMRADGVGSLSLLSVGAAGRALRRRAWQHDLTWGLVVGVGPGTVGRHGDRGRKPLVRPAARPRRRHVDGEQRQRAARLPAGARKLRPGRSLAAGVVGRGPVTPALIPLVCLMLAERPGRVGSGRSGRPPNRRPWAQANPFGVAVRGLSRGAAR